MQMEMCCLHLPSLYLQSAMGSGGCGERGWHLRTTTNNTSQLILYMFGRIFFSLSTNHHDPSPNVASYILFLCRSGVDACKQIQTNDMYAVMQLWQMTHSGICYPKNQTKTKKNKNILWSLCSHNKDLCTNTRDLGRNLEKKGTKGRLL